MKNKKIAWITGAGKINGLGYQTGLALLKKGYHVVFSSRKTDGIAKLSKQDLASFPDHDFIDLDVTSDTSVAAAARKCQEKFGHLDVLINNAGLYQIEDNEKSGDSLLTARATDLMKIFDINTLGSFRMTQAFMPLLQKSDAPRIVNISSGMGGLTEMEGGYPGYRLSKTAVNALTKVTDAEVGGKKLKVNSVCPGWVRTEMGGPGADRSLEEGIAGIVWAATLDEKGPSGGFFRDGERLDW
ncbi:MAG: SDR family NAD(P)-dependent oxidoreductase [Bdellovibrionales bacterium]|nr:SDR family NAD(P)-dependent oxidoreductase [Bdellovibrionales bacterium]